MKLPSALLLSSLLLFTVSETVPAQAVTPPPTPEQKAQQDREHKEQLLQKLPPGSEKLIDAAYAADPRPGTVPGSAQTLDLYVPPGAGPFPLLLWIHGGGWHAGDKEVAGADFAVRFLPHGFAVASLDYRYTTDAAFPAQIEDCEAALAWLRRHAAEHRLNPDKVGAFGHSAGAHLAALMAVTGDTGEFVKEADVSLRLQAAVCWAGPFDLVREHGGWPPGSFVWNPNDVFSKTFFAGGAYTDELARKASPFYYVHPGIPPIRIVHGAKDTTVPPGQASAFADALQKAGVDAAIRIDPDHGHDVMRADSTAEALAFFTQQLR